MECRQCKIQLKEIKVQVYGAKSRVTSYQCPKCHYFEFEPKSAKIVVEELRK